ncbi:hypothetical protein D8T27_14130 [Vibrio vulnificus]|nr:hypothetical protein D8T27_14130 [Vibrio vulnificus]
MNNPKRRRLILATLFSIPVVFEAAALLTAIVPRYAGRPNHIAHYAHRDELSCRLAATPTI